MHVRSTLLALLLAVPAAAATPRAFNLYLGTGQNPSNLHGHSAFKTISFELTFDEPRFIERWTHLHDLEAGTSVSYHDIHQPRSWFGHTYGDPDDSVRSESLFLFLRKQWRATSDIRPFVDLGSGPMWANRRVPAATSRFNFDSQLGVGATFFATSRWPLMAAYRFQHISNGGFTGRNPGLDIHSFFVGTTLRRWR
jgi:opacity protein-like surface antigen